MVPAADDIRLIGVFSSNLANDRPWLRARLLGIQNHVSRLVGMLDGRREMLATAVQVKLALVANRQHEVVE